MKEFGINFSAYHPMLEDQLKEQGIRFIRIADSKRFQRYADAVTNLRLSGIITDADANRAYKRVLKKLRKVIVEI